MAKAKDYAEMTINELNAVKSQLEAKKEEIRAEQKLIVAELDRRAVANKMASMTDKEKEIIRQNIGK